jgi:two-component system, NarL family, nitrate/nitrite response regulator NarL
MSLVKIYLVEPHKLLREGIKSVLQNTGFQLVGESAEWCDAVAALERGTEIDLILQDLPNDRDGAFALLQAMRRAAPNAKIVILTANLDDWVVTNVADAGIYGLLQKDISPMALLHSLHLVMLCEKVFPIHRTFLPTAAREQGKAHAAAEEAIGPVASQRAADLSVREQEILRHLTSGLPNKLIARELKVSETTVKAHIKAILRKIKAGNRTQAAIWSLTRGVDRSGVTSNGRAADGQMLQREANTGLLAS